MIPKILLKGLAGALVLTIVYALLIITVLVPSIKDNTIRLEEQIGEVQLQKTVQMIRSAAIEMQAHSKSLLLGHKNELKNLTAIAWKIIETKEAESHNKNALIIEQKQQEAIELVRKLSYGNNDYFFISDYNNVLLSHPYLQGSDFSNTKDFLGNYIVPPIVDKARKVGDGFTNYWWKKNNSDNLPYEKLSYGRNFKKWNWVVGTGIYIDDIDKEIQSNKIALISRLKTMLKNTTIGKTGYVYIFDADGNMIIHPNNTLEGIKFDKALNPTKNTYIFDDLVNAYKHGDKKLY